MQVSRTKANWIFNIAGAVMIVSLVGSVGIPLLVPQPTSVHWGVLQKASFIANVIFWIVFTWMLFFLPRAEGRYETTTATILLSTWIVNGFILSIFLLGLIAYCFNLL
ncbi:MAG TPA: hypothetical protein VL175_18055 [Pirellulales bacterium]|jgi:hypothetical protein|nr:hypothetical protein [Pirellulales bacterium]